MLSTLTGRRVGLTRMLTTAALALGAAGALPAASQAAVTTFGSSLSVPATHDTAANLNYSGTNAILYGSGLVVHNNHDGADTALWNSSLATGSPTAPAAGQITSVTLEGCAQQASGGPSPLTQIHFQALTPQASGGMLVDVTTQPFDIPVCGVGGASGATQTAYAPTNFCVNAGDYVDFNDEGGFVPTFYPSGVPYQVLGAVPGSSANSYIAGDQTDNGDTLTPTDVSLSGGWAANAGEELMLQATLATGPDATPLCPGGTFGQKAPVPQAGQPGGPPALSIPHPQREGVTHALTVKLSLYCAQALACDGKVTLTNELPPSAASHKTTPVLGTATLAVPGRTPTHVDMKVPASTLVLLRKHRAGIPTMMTVTLANGTQVSQAITLLL